MNKLQSTIKACNITDKIFFSLIKNFNSFKSEKDVARFIKGEIKKRKLRQAFSPIVATGKNASEIHHKPTKDFYPGFCVIDFGVRVNGYCSDMTRTVYIGKPSTKDKKLYNLLLKSQISSIKNAKPNTACKTLAQHNLNMLGKHKNKMIHGLGHGVGKHIHMAPKISLKSKSTLKKGDIVTIEPGLYHKKRLGLRIEDTLVVGGKVLTKSSKKLITINHK